MAKFKPCVLVKDSTLLRVCLVIDHRSCQNVMRTKGVAQSAAMYVTDFLTTFWCFLWSIDVQAHSITESVFFIW